MHPIQGDHNKSHPGDLHAIVQALWSRQRCWAGEEVTISVRTSRVKDSAKIELSIVPDGEYQKSVDTINDQTVTDSKLDHKYPVDWKDKPFGDKRKFAILGSVEKKLPVPLSPVLYVDLEPPIFSA